MKKLVTAASLLLAASVFADVVSSNIVGYSEVTISKQWTILAVNFAAVDDGAAMTINEVFPYSAGMTKGTLTTGDQIQVITTTGSDTYYLSDGNFTVKGKTTYYADRDGKWFKGNATTPSTDPLAPGTALWYGAKGYATPFTVRVAGAVLGTSNADISVFKAWTHIANPYPTELPLNGSNGIGYRTGMTKGTMTTGDQIQIITPTGSDTYYLSDGNFTVKGKTTYYADRDGKWFKGNATTPTTDAIPVGLGAWYGRNGSADIDITIATPVVGD